MRQALFMIVGLLAFFGLVGCQAPVAPMLTGTRPVTAHIHLDYSIESLMTAYSKASINHLRLRLLAQNAQGVYQPTGVTASVATANLGTAVSLGNLKIGSRYRVQADAYADAAETQLISEPTSSLTDFVTPSLVTTNGVAAIDNTPIALSLAVKLADQSYAGHGNITIHVAAPITGKVDYVVVTLYQVSGATATSLLQRTLTYAGTNPAIALTNLKYGTSYRVVTEGYDTASGTPKKLTTDGKSTLNFTVPAPTNGKVDDDLNVVLGTLTVACIH